MQHSTSALSGFLASISLPAMAVLAGACVALALMRKDALPQIFARIIIVAGAATAAVWLSWTLSSADWWTAAKSVIAFGLYLIMIVFGANGLARMLSNEPYNSGQETTEILL
jgi:hypothetical protein